MIIDIKKLTVIIVLMATVFVPCSLAAENPVAAILDKMPAENAAQEKELAAELVKFAPGAMSWICRQIVAPGTGDDSKARYAISSLVSYVSRPDAQPNVKMLYSLVLAKALEKAADKEVKSFFITQLQFVGGDNSVAEVSKYLGDKRLCEPASFTLQTIGTDSAKKAVLKALPTATKDTLPTIIYALGQMRVADAVNGITKHAASKDHTVRLVSLAALAEIGDPSSTQVIANALKVKDPYERGIVASNYVNLAKRLQETGRPEDAVNICKSVLKSKDAAIKSGVKSSALGVIVDALGSKANGYIEDAFDNGDDQLQDAAMTLAAKIGDPSIPEAWNKKIRKVSSQRQVKIVEMLGRRHDKNSLQYLRMAFDDSDNEVKIAIIKAVLHRDEMDKLEAVIYMLQTLKTANAAQVQTIKSLMLQIETDRYASMVIGRLIQTPASAQAALIEVLAERHVSGAFNVALFLSMSKDSSVRIAGTRAMANLATTDDLAKVINIMLNAETSAQRSEASRVVVKLCQKSEGNAAAKPLLAAMKGATIDQQASIINLLSSVGTKQALDVVVTKTKSTNEKLSEAAIRSLAKWKDIQALDALLDTAKTTKPLNLHVITLKAYVALTAKSDIAPAEKVVKLVSAIKTARRSEESNFATSRLLQLKGSGIGALLLDAYTEITHPKIRKKIDEHVKALAKEGSSVNPVGQKPTPEGFISLFNGKDLTGWKGLMDGPYDNPAKRVLLSYEEFAAQQDQANEKMKKHWHVVDGVLYFDGGGHSLATDALYGDFEMLVDWKLMHANGDSGIYLRGSPQVQIWDPAQHKVGSGGLYNNEKNPKNPLVTADNPIGQWNTFRIKMIGEKVTVYLNDKLVVDNVTMENYWDRSKPIFSREQIELQCHGNPVCFRNIFIREIPRPDEFASLFNGLNLAGWVGDTKGYIVKDGNIVCKPGGNLYVANQYSDFVLRFKFKLTPGANNGLGIRTKVGVNAAYDGMELQILDNTAEKYSKLKKYQYHGSIYGVWPADYGEIPATDGGYLKPIGEWNSEEVIAKGNQITVKLNGQEIVDVDIKEKSKDGTIDGRPHPGLFNKIGHIGFLGHGSVVEFKDIKIKQLK